MEIIKWYNEKYGNYSNNIQNLWKCENLKLLNFFSLKNFSLKTSNKTIFSLSKKGKQKKKQP